MQSRNFIPPSPPNSARWFPSVCRSAVAASAVPRGFRASAPQNPHHPSAVPLHPHTRRGLNSNSFPQFPATWQPCKDRECHGIRRLRICRLASKLPSQLSASPVWQRRIRHTAPVCASCPCGLPRQRHPCILR